MAGARRIRPARAADLRALAVIFHAAIHAEPSPYTRRQRRAWAPSVPAAPDWELRLAAQEVRVAEESGGITGFMTLGPGGYVDLAFILPEARGRGVFRDLLRAIEAAARAAGETELVTDASLAAEAPFAACGFTTVLREEVRRRGVALQRARMRKPLTS
ncbi:putative N-acetyltransferase YafP [Roseivivax jejudonensis]|uniref:Putative N-acetyltransferase YafP n=1 Tax=Roseivivax jejudonensis TaxID=1529041 RepID=A0A1X6ZFM9_9RHOB|nr:GNAT family N-acetyltransferase [Roseivivax jejudonensis]SLN49765.1 putative N-acetyltransferase YafP [Roseivivax jejudonensis]